MNIIVDILNIALRGTGKTEIVYKVNLNFKQLEKYATFLIGKGLMVRSVTSGRNVYKTTERGLAFLHRYNETVKLLS